MPVKEIGGMLTVTADGASWPTRFTLTYHPGTGAFTAGFTGIRTH